MAAATIRLGKISSINYTAGKARVVYEDRDDSVTSELPFLALQYNIPKVDDLVVVACFSNGTVSGVILGPVYNSANTPHEGGAGIFRQEMSNNVNEAVMSYSEKKQTMDCQHFFRQIFLGYFSDIVQAFDTLRKNVCGDDYTSLHNPIVLSSVLPAYGMFHSIQILFL